MDRFVPTLPRVSVSLSVHLHGTGLTLLCQQLYRVLVMANRREEVSSGNLLEPNLDHPALVSLTRPTSTQIWPIANGGDLIEVEGTGLWIYEARWYAALGGELPYDVLMRIVFDGVNTRCDELRMLERPDDRRPLRSSDLRAIPMDWLLRTAIDQQTVYHLGENDQLVAVYGKTAKQSYRKGLATLAARGRRRTTEDQLERVAKVYRAAVASGQPPTAAVERELRLKNRNTAKKWVQRARAAGCLPPALGERRGGMAT
jgi:hypothetical protein